MGQFACVIYIVAITSLCCVSAMYINKNRNEDDIIASNIMKVFGSRRYMDNKKHETTHLDLRSLVEDAQNYPQVIKKQSQLTFIIKPGAATQQPELTTIPGNHSNDHGVIFIQVPAYVNHTYSLFLHPPKNSTIHNDTQEINDETANDSTNDVTSRPENFDQVDSQNNDMEQIDNDADNKPMMDQESDMQEPEGNHESNVIQEAEQNDDNVNEVNIDDSESNIEAANVNGNNMNEHNLETPEINSEGGSQNNEGSENENANDATENANPTENNNEAQSENEQNIETSNHSDDVNNIENGQSDPGNNEANIENSSAASDPAEDVTENDDCDEDIDESQDFPNENEQPSVTEGETQENPIMESGSTIADDTTHNTDDLNGEENENGVDLPDITQQDESLQNDETNNINDVEPTSQIETNGEADSTTTNASPTNIPEKEDSDIGNNDMESPQPVDQNEDANETVPDNTPEETNVNENVDSDNQNNGQENIENENNDINNGNSENSAKPEEDDNHKEGQGNPTENGQSDYDDDAQNTLDQNEQTPSIVTGSGTLNTSLKEFCLETRGQFASPNSCRKYVNCWDGMPYEHDCPPGLFFNQDLGLCDWKHKVDCEDRPLESPMAANCAEHPHSAFRNPNDCSEYFVCVTADPVKFKCPDGLNYNEILGVCDHKYRVNCGNSTSLDSDNTTKVESKRISPGLVTTATYCKPDYVWRVGRSCRRVDICSSEGRVQQVRCPTLTAYDIKAKKCIYEGTARC